MHAWRGARWLLLVVPGLSMLAVNHAVHAEVAVLGGQAAWSLALDAVAGTALVATGCLIITRVGLGYPGLALLVAGCTLPLAVLPPSATTTGATFTAALALAPTAGTLVAMTTALWPTTAAGSRLTLGPLALLGCGWLAQGPVPAALFAPRASGCFTCPPNYLLISGSTSGPTDAMRTGLVCTAIGCIAGVGVALVRYAAASRSTRRIEGAVVVSLVLFAGVTSALAIRDARRQVSVPDGLDSALWRTQAAVIVLIALAVVLRNQTIHREAAAVAQNVLSSGGDPSIVQPILAVAAGDLAVTLSVPRITGWLDETGDAVPVPAGRGLSVERAGQVVADIRLPSSRAGALDRIRALAQASAISLERLAARSRLRAELADLTESRLRLVEAMDAERRGLERDLHDGAQQRLLALLVETRRGARRGPVEHRARYAEVTEQLTATLAETRAIAHGIHEVALTEAGLATGLRALIDGSGIEVTLEVRQVRRATPTVEAAVYQLVADLLAASETEPSATLSVSVGQGDQVLTVRAVSTVDASLGHAPDRIEALGGTLKSSRIAEGYVYEAEVPTQFP